MALPKLFFTLTGVSLLLTSSQIVRMGLVKAQSENPWFSSVFKIAKVETASDKAVTPAELSADLLQQRQALGGNDLCSLASQNQARPQTQQDLLAQENPGMDEQISQVLTPMLPWLGTFEAEKNRDVVQVLAVPGPELAAMAQKGDRPELQAHLIDPAISTAELKSVDPRENTNDQWEYQLWAHEHFLLQTTDLDKVKAISRRLNAWLDNDYLDVEDIRPALINGQFAVMMNRDILTMVDKTMFDQTHLNIHPQILAIRLTNNLRLAMGAEPLNLVEAQKKIYHLEETGKTFEGTASWYGPYFHGRLTANGEIYDQYGLTAAHPSLPLGTFLKFTNLRNGNSIIIRINDRGPYIPPRSIDLSRGAAQCVESIEKGVVPYRAEIMKVAP